MNKDQSAFCQLMEMGSFGSICRLFEGLNFVSYIALGQPHVFTPCKNTIWFNPPSLGFLTRCSLLCITSAKQQCLLAVENIIVR